MRLQMSCDTPSVGVSAALCADGALPPPSSTGAPPLQQHPRPKWRGADKLVRSGYTEAGEVIRQSQMARERMAREQDAETSAEGCLSASGSDAGESTGVGVSAAPGADGALPPPPKEPPPPPAGGPHPVSAGGSAAGESPGVGVSAAPGGEGAGPPAPAHPLSAGGSAAGESPGVGVSAAPGGEGAGSLAPAQDVDWARLRGSQIFTRLKAGLVEELRPQFERYTLSYHSSQTCRAKDEGSAPIPSLKTVGIDAPIWGQDGLVRVRLQFPNSFALGDGRRFSYESLGCRRHTDAVLEASTELLAYLLALEPNRVRLPPKCFKRGEAGVEAVRQHAWAAHNDRRTSPQGDPWAGPIGAKTPASQAAPPPPPRGGRSKSNYEAPSPGENRDATILDELAKWQWHPKGKVINRRPNEDELRGAKGVTRYEIEFLDRMLKPGGFRPFLDRHSAYFNFGDTPSGKGVWFQYIVPGAAGVSAAAPPATGAAGVSTAAPPAAQRAQGSTGAAGVAAGQGSVVFQPAQSAPVAVGVAAGIQPAQGSVVATAQPAQGASAATDGAAGVFAAARSGTEEPGGQAGGDSTINWAAKLGDGRQLRRAAGEATRAAGVSAAARTDPAAPRGRSRNSHDVSVFSDDLDAIDLEALD